MRPYLQIKTSQAGPGNLHTLHFQSFGVLFAPKGQSFSTNIFDFTTAGGWDCVTTLKRFHALHYNVDYIVLSFGIMDAIVQV